MSCSLLSFIGTGSYTKDQGYTKTDYRFPNGKVINKSLFFEALLESNYHNINKIILIGTDTSAWDILVEDTPLWANLYERREQNIGISEEQVAEIQKILTDRYRIPVVIKHHTPIIDNTTDISIFECYTSIVPELGNDDILLDITHCYRSMPILLYQALLFSLSNNEILRNVNLIYGELKDRRSPAIARDLSNYWTFAQITSALDIFNSKLDGFKLAELTQKDWPEGAKVIKRISNIIQSNYSLQIIETLQNINNVCKKSNNLPSWCQNIKNSLLDLLKIQSANMPRTLFNFSKLLFDKKLITQAVISLQITVETAIANKYATPAEIGDYDWWSETGKSHLTNLVNNHKDLKQLFNLQHTRNQIAHGGARNRDTTSFPNAENIKNIYESSIKNVDTLLKILKF